MHRKISSIPSAKTRAPEALELARHEGILQDFELLCVYTAMEQWGRHDAPGRLFVNISADALVHGVQLIGATELGNTVLSLGLSARMLVLEITEHERVEDMDKLAEAVHFVRRAGVSLALDDFGDGRSSLRLWSQLKPEVVKIDKYFTGNISHDQCKTAITQRKTVVIISANFL